MRADIPPREILVQRVEAHEAYYWQEDEKTLWVAVRYDAPSLLGDATRSQWLLTLRLEGAPAGRERLYKLDDHSVRTALHQGPLHQRAASMMGVAVVAAPRGGILAGRFHVDVRQQQFSTLAGGWSPEAFRAPLVVVTGSFKAVESQREVQAILALTQADGWEHTRGQGLPLITRPTSTQPRSSSHQPATGPSQELK